MATKLKKMKLTSVDLVRAGANQEADICLYKSADPQEATEGPTEDEMNIFKRFIAFIRGTPTEAKNEPHSPIEKADEPADIESIYKSALVDSIHSIYTDDNLTEIEKKAMAEQSIGQFQERMKETLRDDDDWDDDWDDDDPDDWNDDTDDDPDDDRYDDIEEIDAPVHKYNHNHGADGRFTTSGGGGGGVRWHTTGSSGGKIGRNFYKPESEIRYIQTNEEQKKPTLQSNRFEGMEFTSPEIERARNRRYRGGATEHVKTLNNLPKKNGMSKVSYEEIKAYEKVLNKMPKGTKLLHPHSAGTDTFERTSDSEQGISWKHTRAPWGKVNNVSSFDVGHWLAGSGNISRGEIKLTNDPSQSDYTRATAGRKPNFDTGAKIRGGN